MPHTILWPTELSSTSLKAIPHINSLAEKYGSRVIALYVAPDICSMFPAYGSYPSPELVEKFQDWALEKSKDDLRSICSQQLKGCPNVDVRIVRGDAVDQILKMAAEEDTDMIVMTTRGQGFEEAEKEKGGFGSVARKVAEQSPVPVHLINPTQEEES
ncbi:MAG: universal stress protein [Thermodesulfobacteriota bacterium]